MRNFISEEDKQKIIFDKNHEPRRFDYIIDPCLRHLKDALDESMKESAEAGKGKGIQKDKRTPLKRNNQVNHLCPRG